MIDKLEQLIALKDFSLEKGKLIVNNILYIDPDNLKALKLKDILTQYEKDIKEKALKQKEFKEKALKEKEIKRKNDKRNKKNH